MQFIEDGGYRDPRLWLADGDFIDLDWAGPHDAETPLVLALHELATNAVKYGALGVPGGEVRLVWSVAAGLLA